MFDRQARIIRRRPILVIMVISAITMALLAGNLVQDIPPAPVTAGNEAFLPDDEALLAAADEDFTTVSRADIGTDLDLVARTPALAEASAGLDRFVPRDAAGDPLAGLSLISLNESGDPLGLEAAQLRAHEIARSTDVGALEVSVFSVAQAGADSEESRTSSTVLLMILASAAPRARTCPAAPCTPR